MDKKKAGAVVATVLYGAVIAGTMFGPLGLINNDDIKNDLKEAETKPIVTQADEEHLNQLREKEKVSTAVSLTGVFGLAGGAGALMGYVSAKLNNKAQEVNEQSIQETTM